MGFDEFLRRDLAGPDKVCLAESGEFEDVLHLSSFWQPERRTDRLVGRAPSPAAGPLTGLVCKSKLPALARPVPSGMLLLE